MMICQRASIWDTVQADSHREHLTKNRRYPRDQKYGSLTRFPRCTKRKTVVDATEEERERQRGEKSRKEERQRRPKESAGARDREHAKEEESAAFTRIPADPSKSPLRSARLTLRRASLQVGHATTHRSTLGRTLPSPLLVSSLSPFPPSYYHHHHRCRPPPSSSSAQRSAGPRAPSPSPPTGFLGPLASPHRPPSTPWSRRQLQTSPPRTPSSFPPSSFSHLFHHVFLLPAGTHGSPTFALLAQVWWAQVYTQVHAHTNRRGSWLAVVGVGYIRAMPRIGSLEAPHTWGVACGASGPRKKTCVLLARKIQDWGG